MIKKTKIGILGSGKISNSYIPNIINKFGFVLEISGIADLNQEAAAAAAEKHGLNKEVVCTPDELLANEEIKIILNLTNIAAHAELNMKILESGKHCYSEKPLALRCEDAVKIMALADKRNLRVGCAPDCFLGAAHQTARYYVDSGLIGTPLYATVNVGLHIQVPPYFTEKIGGVLFDMAPYYIAALINIFGPVKRVTGFASIPFKKKRNEMPAAEEVGMYAEPEVPTLASGVIEFVSGAMASIAATTEAAGYIPRFNVTGTQGTLICGDPNMFNGTVSVECISEPDIHELPNLFEHYTESRGLGLADMAYAIQQNRAHRANGHMAVHIVEVLQALRYSDGNAIEINSNCDRPAPMRKGFKICSFYD